GVSPPTSSRVTVRAVSDLDPAAQAQAFDDAVAAIVRVYEDDAHAVNVAAIPPCATAHALASGLPPSTAGYRFAWRDSAGTARRLTAVASDAGGRAADDWTAGPGDTSSWRVDIDSFDGV